MWSVSYTHLVGRVRGQRQGRQNAVLVQQNNGLGIALAFFQRTGERHQPEVDAVSVRELHQITITARKVCGLSRRMVHLVGRLHDEPLPKHVDPARLRPEGCGFLHYIHDVVVLKNIPGRVGVGARAVHKNSAYARIPFGYAQNERRHFALCTHIHPPLFAAACQ